MPLNKQQKRIMLYLIGTIVIGFYCLQHLFISFLFL
jgi:hypothetical protein